MLHAGYSDFSPKFQNESSSQSDSVKLNGEVENHIHPISIPTLNNSSNPSQKRDRLEPEKKSGPNSKRRWFSVLGEIDDVE